MIAFLRKLKTAWSLDQRVAEAETSLAEAHDALSIIENQIELSAQALLARDAEVQERQAALDRLNAEIAAAKEERHEIIKAAVRNVELRGRRMLLAERDKGIALAKSIVADADADADRLMAGADAYIAAMYNATLDGVLKHIHRRH